MSRSYKPTELKRRFRPAIEELEVLGFLAPLPEAERYVWQSRGVWRIILVRGPMGREAGGAVVASEKTEMTEALALRGVSAKAAADLVESYPGERIRFKIEVFDWLVKSIDKRVNKNASGYLVQSIRDDYQAPDGYTPPDEAERLIETERQLAEAERRRRSVEAAAADHLAKREADLKARWNALDEARRDAIAAQVKADHPGLRRWKTLMEPLCLAELEKRLMDGGELPRRPMQGTLFPEGGK